MHRTRYQLQHTSLTDNFKQNKKCYLSQSLVLTGPLYVRINFISVPECLWAPPGCLGGGLRGTEILLTYCGMMRESRNSGARGDVHR
jgi:hypothetical protein